MKHNSNPQIVRQYELLSSSVWKKWVKQLGTPNVHVPHNPNPTVITDPQIGPGDTQIFTVQIRRAEPPRSAFCRVPMMMPKSSISDKTHTKTVNAGKP